MPDQLRSETAVRAPRQAGAMMLAGGGFAAAFAAASCCALPLLLGGIGIGGAWLAGVARLAAPYQTALLVVASLCLGAGGALVWRRRANCAPGEVCARSVLQTLTTVTLSFGIFLLALGVIFA